MKRASLLAAVVVGAAFVSPGGVWATSASSTPSAGLPITAPQTPPPGWEIAPRPVEIKSTKDDKKKSAPACCAYDVICCSRQTDIDNFVPFHVSQSFEPRLADFPEAVLKEAPKEGPFLEGVGDVRIIDGTGAPFPWMDGPKEWEIRITPPGELGDIKFFDDSPRGYFDKMEYRGMGSGAMRSIKETPDKGRSLITGPIEYSTFNRGEGGKIIHDEVKGKLEGSPKVLATSWLHVEAINLADGVVYGYRAMHEGQPHVFFVMPEVLLGFESWDAQKTGGFFRHRWATAFPYTLYHFPIGSGRSNMINCVLRDFEVRRWFERPKDAKPFPAETFICFKSKKPPTGGFFISDF